MYSIFKNHVINFYVDDVCLSHPRARLAFTSRIYIFSDILNYSFYCFGSQFHLDAAATVAAAADPVGETLLDRAVFVLAAVVEAVGGVVGLLAVEVGLAGSSALTSRRSALRGVKVASLVGLVHRCVVGEVDRERLHRGGRGRPTDCICTSRVIASSSR